MELVEHKEAPWGEVAANLRLLYLTYAIQISQADPNPKKAGAKVALKSLKTEMKKLRDSLFNF